MALISTPVLAREAPDPSLPGPYEVKSGEYRMPPSMNPDVLGDRVTEIWGKVWLPSHAPNGLLPVVVFLHGNHATCGSGSNPRIDASCEYTSSGACPAGQVVVPNHEGYSYLAERLASQGFAVFSINANRGITCSSGGSDDWGLNLARGRLVLAHLALLSSWNTQGGAPMTSGPIRSEDWIGRLDLTNVGLMGHSRGGEGARAALNQFNDPGSPWPAKIPGLRIRAIFEIGAVDGQTSRVLDADGVAWNQLLPMCDGDVSDLEGRRPFERMLAKKDLPPASPKSLLMVYGANHNYFNTEWQSSDSDSCADQQPMLFSQPVGSPQQQAVALSTMSAFFRSNMMREKFSGLNQNFNPLYSIFRPLTLITRIDRDYAETFPSSQPGGALIEVDKFDETSAQNRQVSNVTVTNGTLGWGIDTKTIKVTWGRPGSDVFLQSTLGSPLQGINADQFRILEFRAARPVSATTPGAADFSVALKLSDGRLSKAVAVSAYADLVRPGNPEQLLQTVRIPLADFGLSQQGLGRIQGLRLIFDRQPSGEVLLANINLSAIAGVGAEVALPPPTDAELRDQSQEAPLAPPPSLLIKQALAELKKKVEIIPAALNRVRGTRVALHLGERYLEIDLSSRRPFLPQDQLYSLHVGGREFKMGMYPDPSDLSRIRFRIPLQFSKLLQERRNLEIHLGPSRIWKF